MNIGHTNQTKKPEPAQTSTESNTSKSKSVEPSVSRVNITTTEKDSTILDNKEEQPTKTPKNSGVSSEKTSPVNNNSKSPQLKNPARHLETASTQQKVVSHLPPIECSANENGVPIYTLVLDLDETLVHYEEVESIFFQQ